MVLTRSEDQSWILDRAFYANGRGYEGVRAYNSNAPPENRGRYRSGEILADPRGVIGLPKLYRKKGSRKEDSKGDEVFERSEYRMFQNN